MSYSKLIKPVTTGIAELLIQVQPEQLLYDYIGHGRHKPIFLINRFDEESMVKPLLFPVVFDNYVVTDLRQYVSSKEGVLSFSKNYDSILFEVMRSVFMCIDEDTPAKLKPMYPAVITVCDEWVTNTIGNMTSLNILEKYDVKILMNLYLNKLLYKGSYSDTKERIRQQLRITERDIERVITECELKINSDELGGLDTIYDLIAAIQKVSPKLKSFSLNTLSTLLSRTVLINNKTYNTLLALEHLPTLLTTIYIGFTSTLNKRSTFSKIWRDSEKNELTNKIYQIFQEDYRIIK